MKTIIVKFEFPDESLEGYEDCVDELIIEDHLHGCSFDHVWFEVLAQKDLANFQCPRCKSFDWDYVCSNCGFR